MEKKKRGDLEVVMRWIYNPNLDPVYFTDAADEDVHPDRPPNELKIALVRAKDILAADKASLLSRSSAGGTSDPVVTMTIARESTKSTVKKKTLEPVWNEVFRLPVDDPDSVLTVAVHDWDRASANDFLGRIVVPMAVLGDARVPVQRWYMMGGPTDEDLVDEEQAEDGSWKVVSPPDKERGSIEVALQWWHNPELDPEFFVGEDDGHPNRQPNELRVALVRAIDLLPMDVGIVGKANSSDPYVKIKCGDAQAQTSVVKKTLNPRWREVLALPVGDADLELEVSVFDYDTVGAHDFMGKLVVPIASLVDKQRDQEWHVLGGQDGAEDGVSRGELELALHWWFNPKLEPEFFVDEVDQFYAREPNLLKFAVIRARNLPAVDKGLLGTRAGSVDAVVRIVLGSDHEQKTLVKKKQRDPVWNQEFSIATEDKREKLVFFVEDWNLVKNTPIGSVALQVAPLFDKHTERRWFNIVPAGQTVAKPATPSQSAEDRPSGEHGAAAAEAADGLDAWAAPNQDEPPPCGEIELAFKWVFDKALAPSYFDGEDEYPEEDLNELCVAAIQARGLPAMDRKMFSKKRSGSGDPMVIFRVGKKKLKSKVIKNTLSPKWHEPMTMALSEEDGLMAEYLEISVFDWDITSTDFIGRVKVPLEPLAEDRLLVHRWFELGNEHGEVEAFEQRGEIEVALRWHYEPKLDPNFKASAVFDWEDPDVDVRRRRILARAGERFGLSETSSELMLRRSPVNRDSVALIGGLLSLDLVALTKVDLRESDLTPDDVAALSKQLATAPLLQHLNISRNCLADVTISLTKREVPRCMSQLGRALGRNSVLVHLDVSESRLQPLGLTQLAQGLRDNFTIKFLSLRENPLCLVNEYGRGDYEVAGIVALAGAVKLHCSLEMLILSKTQLCGQNSSGVGVYRSGGLVEIVRAFRFNRTIKQLDLTGNSIVEAGGSALVHDLAADGNFETRRQDRSKRSILVLQRHMVPKARHTDFKSF